MKPTEETEVITLTPVAPHAGAWIETVDLKEIEQGVDVAPHAGAWIETDSAHHLGGQKWSLPMRERGLKQLVTLLMNK